MGFWPYLRQEYSSGGMSAIFALIAGTLTVLLNLSFLLPYHETTRKTKNRL